MFYILVILYCLISAESLVSFLVYNLMRQKDLLSSTQNKKEMRFMNIVFVTHYTGLYGANKSLLEVILNMKKLFNINTIVITPGIGQFNKELNKNNIENYSFKYYQWVKNEKNSKFKEALKYLRYKTINNIGKEKIIKVLQTKNIDIVHTNSSVIDIGANIAKKLGTKHVWHLREFGKEDYDLVYYNGLEKAAKFINNNSERVICISNSLKNKYKDIIYESKLKLIYNGINEKNYFIDISSKNFTEEFNIIFAGLITPNKNQIELVKAMDILVNNKELKVYAHFLGNGDVEYLKKLKTFVASHNLQKNVFFHGRVEDVNKYINKSYVGVISSQNEAFGRVTVEYMMGGLAVIASNTGANPEIISDGIDGFIYKLGDAENLSKKIESLYNDREKLKKISINAQNKAITEFTSDINCENIYNLYKEVLD